MKYLTAGLTRFIREASKALVNQSIIHTFMNNAGRRFYMYRAMIKHKISAAPDATRSVQDAGPGFAIPSVGNR